MDTIAGLAAQAGIALELAAARRGQEQARWEAERERIAARLREDVINRLLGISTALAGRAGRLREPGNRAALLELATQIDHIARDVGSTVFDLRPHTV